MLSKTFVGDIGWDGTEILSWFCGSTTSYKSPAEKNSQKKLVKRLSNTQEQQENPTGLEYPWTASTALDDHGRRHINAILREVLQRIWCHEVSVSSNFARRMAPVIGMAASISLITTQIAPNRFANAWQITTRGLEWLKETE